MARALIAVGVRPEHAYEVARRVEVDVAGTGKNAADIERVQARLYETLGPDEGADTYTRLLRYRDLQRLEAPIIVLIGGATGTGKSTVATELAHRLGITRVTSTDFVRQTMRAFFSEDFMPAIHVSSFEAGVEGFVEQTQNVLVGVTAAIERAQTESWSIVLEGVHLVPGTLPTTVEGALVVQCVLAIEDEAVHESHFLVRDVASEGRRAGEKYLRAFGEIRAIQDVIVERAARAGVPVVHNYNIETTIDDVMDLVLARAAAFEEVRA
jgi:2-phosphoglycerate kinase